MSIIARALSRFPILAAGGMHSAKSALRFLHCGVVQVRDEYSVFTCTAFISSSVLQLCFPSSPMLSLAPRPLNFLGRGPGKVCAHFVLSHNYSYYTENNVRTNSNIHVYVTHSYIMCVGVEKQR